MSATIPATPNLYSRYYNIFIKAAKPKEVKPKEELTSNTSPGKENLENARIEEEKVGQLIIYWHSFDLIINTHQNKDENVHRYEVKKVKGGIPLKEH